MCGIAGWIDWEVDLRKEEKVLKKMTETMANRGPDDSGIWLSPEAAFGHRRLSVVDPEGGKQPMVRPMGGNNFVVTYNGELYNTAELRQELSSLGYTFTTHSDTEVLLLSYMQWGPTCVEKFNGIFAFAIWNTEEKSLFLARDRLGVKPLFYSEKNRQFFFASEIKAILAHPQMDARLTTEGLSEIFALGPSRTPGNGVFSGINELRPGYWLLYQKNKTTIRRYWQLKSKPHTDSLEKTAAHLRELMQDIVQRQLIADVPVCTLLSGGLDSSALTALAAQEFAKNNLGPLHTYSVDYLDNEKNFTPSSFQPSSDEPWIKVVSKYVGTQHRVFNFDTPELVSSLKAAVKARDLPGMADVDSSLYLFCRQIKKEATVALSGECADEIFGGYPWFHNSESLNSGNFPWLRSGDVRASLLSPEIRQRVHPNLYAQNRYQETIAEVPLLKGESPLESRRREMFYLNMHWFMNTLLDRKDRMSMATGLEVRVPFCDHRLVEYVWNIPWEMKNVGGMEKGILRKALKGFLPEPVLHRKKSPYPKTHNPNYLTAVEEWLSSILKDPSSPLLSLIDIQKVKPLTKLDSDFLHFPWFGQLMTGPQLIAYLCQVDTWLRHYHITID